ncbi:ABC transporter ATP-binding protein, partial [Streptococcus pyogenes]
LFLKFYPLESGELTVFIDGKSPRNLKEWRNQFCLVSQNAQLFKGNVRSNLCLGLEEISDEEIWQALEIAQAKDFLEAKDGLESSVEAMG